MFEKLRCRLFGHADRKRTVVTKRITGLSTTSSTECYRIVDRCPRCEHDLPAMLNTQPYFTINSTYSQ
jgi:hypothetical protein